MKYEETVTPDQLIQYMTQNIHYGFVSKNGKIYKEQGTEEWNNDWYPTCIVQDGESLIESHYGTCWDQVELERKWFDEHNYQYKTIFMWFEVNRPSNLPTHAFLLFKRDNKYYWFEHAFEPYKGIHEFDSEENLIEYVKDKQLEYAIETGISTWQDRDFIKCYEYTKPESHLGVDDYIYHVTHSMNKVR
ncbi:MAG: hypothetical protein PHN72_02055 [Bacilli bacterium]|nr:hypothetical protein [Bacilli bacterium]